VDDSPWRDKPPLLKITNPRNSKGEPGRNRFAADLEKKASKIIELDMENSVLIKQLVDAGKRKPASDGQHSTSDAQPSNSSTEPLAASANYGIVIESNPSAQNLNTVASRAASVIGTPVNLALYHRNNNYAMIALFDTRSTALGKLQSVQESFRYDAYVANLNDWCPNATSSAPLAGVDTKLFECGF
jgi:hypothetical protein